MPRPRNINIIRLGVNPLCSIQLNLALGEAANRDQIRRFVWQHVGVDVPNESYYILRFHDLDGVYISWPQTFTVRRTFEDARSILNRQRVVYVDLWLEHDPYPYRMETTIKTENQTEIKNEFKTETEIKTEIKTETQTDIKTEIKTESQTEIKTEIKTE